MKHSALESSKYHIWALIITNKLTFFLARGSEGITHRDGGGGSGTQILGHTDGSLRSPPRVRNLVPERPPIPVCKEVCPYSPPKVCRFRLVCKDFCHYVCSLKFIFCWRNAEVNIERNGGCEFFERCSWNVLRLYREQSRPSNSDWPRH